MVTFAITLMGFQSGKNVMVTNRQDNVGSFPSQSQEGTLLVNCHPLGSSDAQLVTHQNEHGGTTRVM